jgi:hypothetical protein
MKDFIKEYFIQTRQDINAEKSSRDQILNFVILAIGGVGFALLQNKEILSSLKGITGFAVESGVLLAITSLFWLRHSKLIQIADRWYALAGLLANNQLGIPYSHSVESIVTARLATNFYTKKDALVCIGVSCPIYAAVVVTTELQYELQYALGVALGVALVHSMVVWKLLVKPLPRPEQLLPLPPNSAATPTP